MKRLLVPGVFDVFHIGHLNYLKKASEYGDYVIVAIQEDRVVELAKRTAMVTPLPERVALIEQLRFVDEVVSYIDVFQGPLLAALNVDVFACGEEYGGDPKFPDQTRTLEYCKDNHIEVVRIPRTAHVSSTRIRSRLKAFWASRAEKSKDLPAGVTVLGSFDGNQNLIDEETEREVNLILETISDAKNYSLLDMGCGDGRLLVRIAPFFKNVTGVEYSDDLLDLARKHFGELGQHRLIVADVSCFLEEKTFDIFLLSGITPCLDDVQMSDMLSNISKMSAEHSTCMVRASVSLGKRINVVNQFSSELGSVYTAYYRTVAETETAFLKYGWHCREHFQLYQHRLDTAVWWFEFFRRS
ncbi:MAG: adenylyltransferase/cytidyltransferase family protein [Betaproteobacteria bacterium]|nr:adenylyltransferase/cytidyltransferase family protein [Betaproteobacteria bacterium]